MQANLQPPSTEPIHVFKSGLSWAHRLLVLVVVVPSFLTVLGGFYLTSGESDGVSFTVLSSLVVAFLCVMLASSMLFLGAVIGVGATGISVSLRAFFKKHIDYRDIRTIEVGPATGAGFGLGYGKKSNGWTYYLSGGPTILITLKDDSHILVSARNPDTVLATIEPYLNRALGL